MNLRIATNPRLKPSETHISDVSFKHIKIVKTFRHMALFTWTRYEGGIYLTKGRRIYKLIISQDNSMSIARWSYNLLNVSYGSITTLLYKQFTGINRIHHVKDYLNYIIDNKFADFIFVLHTSKGIIELTDAIHIKKYKVARKTYELKVSAKELREKASKL